MNMPSMGSPSELTLECRPSAKTSATVIKALPRVGDQLARMQKLEDYLKGLEEERLKIEAFKRELPFCMQLLNDAIGASKEHLASYQSYAERRNSSNKEEQKGPISNHRPVLEEFIPIKKTCEEPGKKSEEIQLMKTEKYAKEDRPNWMSSAQLWSQNYETKENTATQQDSHAQQTFPWNPKSFLDSKQRIGGAFLPSSREKQETPRCSADRTLPDLGLSSGEQEAGSSLCNDAATLNNYSNPQGKPNETAEARNEAAPRSNGTNPSPTESQSGGQTQRKARRCWSPELHRRFVNALQQLGGSQVATPKQIRELMKVDGLTNDEVKSHLQKYRLHTRRPSPIPHSLATQAPQLVVLGGIWVPPEYATTAAHQAPGLYNALSTTNTQSHSRYCQSPMPQEYYSQRNQSSQLHLYCTDQKQIPSHAQGSPLCRGHDFSGARGMSGECGRVESTGEDGKSESTSWKDEENTENHGDMRNIGRGLSLRRQPQQSLEDNEDGEDST
eukprot:Gb_34639 [translate_table: standard]